MREQVLISMAAEYPEEIPFIQECMDIFLKSRSNILPNLYPDTMSCLEYLKTQSQSMKIGILSNGNCDFHLQENNVFSRFFDFTLSATETGCSKPCLTGFLACLQMAGNPLPSRTLVIGDDYEKDVIGAKNMGMATAYLVRNTEEYQRLMSTDLKEKQIDFLLNSLEPNHLENVFFPEK
jgi:FMN phosphatase YigB (HAD superfamily)